MELRVFVGAVTAMVVAVLISGCTPPGPRALLKGKKWLDAGRYADAIVQFETATSLMDTNAQAWNYLGLAYHHSGRTDDARNAYLRALSLDRALAEARYNLGCLYLEQGDLDAAKSAFIAYSLDRQNSMDGYLKLGAVLTRTGDLAGAEKAFQRALSLSTNNPEGLTGLGMIRQRRGNGAEAAQFFAAALKQDPNYGPALLNYGVMAQTVLRDRALAIRLYERYLALRPSPPRANEVSNVLRQLRIPTTEAARMVAGATQRSNVLKRIVGQGPTAPQRGVTGGYTAQVAAGFPQNNTAGTSTAKTQATKATQAKAGPATGLPAVVTGAAGSESAPIRVAGTDSGALSSLREMEKTSRVEMVQLAPEPELRTGSDVKPQSAKVEPAGTKAPRSAGTPVDSPQAKHGFFSRINPLNLLGKSDAHAQSPATSKPVSSNVQPSVAPGSVSAGETQNPAVRRQITEKSALQSSAAQESAGRSMDSTQRAASSPRYKYVSPQRPVTGDAAGAERVFLEGVKAHREGKVGEAVESYRRAVGLDPAFFSAHFNIGLVLAERGDFAGAARAYETALVIRPDSQDARYNFALLLKQHGYTLDAAAQLERLVIYYPKDCRAHVTLGNLYAQQLKNTAEARDHYTKALEADPRNPQAGAIRYWLMENRN